jgi:hypothetical protein
MKMPFQIIAAAAAVLSGLIRQLMGAANPPHDPPPEDPLAVPPMTAALVAKLAYAGGTDAEIADRFLVDQAKLTSEFRDALRVSRVLRRLTLRSRQFDMARKSNASLLIWLGRNELGQSLSPTSPGEPMPGIEEEKWGGPGLG